MDDFTYYHQELLAERNGQWLDENGNTSLWLSQGCYISMKCIVTGGWIISLVCHFNISDGVQPMSASLKSSVQSLGHDEFCPEERE